jgi:hypothetical protein
MSHLEVLGSRRLRWDWRIFPPHLSAIWPRAFVLLQSRAFET